MLKTRKLISLVLVVAMILSMGIVGMVSAAADDDTYYLVGTITDWQAADYVFTANEAAEGEYYLNGVALSSGDELKVNNGGDSWFPSGMNNNYVVAEDGTYNVYFRPDGQGGSDWHEGFFYLEIAGESVDPTEAPADPTEAPADPTEAPADPTEAPADPTEAPADPTEAPADPTEAPAEPGTGAEIKIDGVTYNAHVGDTIHYEFFLDMSGVKGDGTHPGKATEIDASLYYDHSKLKLLTSIEDDEETRINPFVPNLSKITSNDTGSKVTYNGTNGNTATGEDAYTKGYNFTEKRVLVHADFEVIAGGSSEIVHIFENLGSGDVKVIYLQTANPDYPIATETVVSVDCPHTTEPTTAEPTTAEPTTASDKAIITVKDHIAGTEETRTYSIGDKFVVIATLNVPDGYRVNSIDVWQEFNIGDATLKVLTDVDDDDDVFPQIGDPTANVAGNIIKVNATKAKYKQSYKFSTADTGEEAATLMRIEYEVIAAGKTTIETQIKTMALIVDGDDMQDAVKGGEKLDGAPEFKTTTVFDGEAPVEPTTAEPTTAEPTTAEPTTAEPTTAEPTTAEPTTAEPTTAEPTTAEPTTAEPTTAEPTTAEPTTAEPTEAKPGLWVVADGKWYAVESGQVYEYVYYLNTGEKVCSLDAETFFDTNGLELKSDTEDGLDELFPILKDAVVLNDLVAGRLKYNYSAAKGKNFDTDDCELIHAKFLVTAEEGVYHINTFLHTVAGADEHKYIFKDEQIEDLKRSEGVIDGLTPGDDHPTDPTSAEPTETKPGLWVVADGKWYEVESGKEYDYIYYLNTGEKVCSLDAETFFDTKGLELKSDTENGLDELFPILKDAVVLNDLVAGRLKYNYSAAKGKDFNTDDSELIHAKFLVTAEEGVYHIDTFLHTVAGADEHKYIFKDEDIDELQRSEGVIDGLTPGDDHPTEPTSAEPTTAEPTTAEPTTAEPTTAEPTTAEPTTAEPTSDVPDLAIYYFEQESYDYYKGDGGDLVMVVHNDKDDTVTFQNFDKLLINDKEATNVVYAEGSLIITVPADQIANNFNDGSNRVAAFFSDAEGSYVAAADVNIYDGNAPTEAPEETVAPTAAPATSGKSTSDSSSTTTNTSTVKTGSTEMAIIFLMILVMAAGVVIFTKKRKID